MRTHAKALIILSSLLFEALVFTPHIHIYIILQLHLPYITFHFNFDTEDLPRVSKLNGFMQKKIINGPVGGHLRPTKERRWNKVREKRSFKCCWKVPNKTVQCSTYNSSKLKAKKRE